MVHVVNGRVVMVTFPGFYVGPAAVQIATDGEKAKYGARFAVAWKADPRARLPRVGTSCQFEGQTYQVVSLGPSAITAGVSLAWID